MGVTNVSFSVPKRGIIRPSGLPVKPQRVPRFGEDKPDDPRKTEGLVEQKTESTPRGGLLQSLRKWTSRGFFPLALAGLGGFTYQNHTGQQALQQSFLQEQQAIQAQLSQKDRTISDLMGINTRQDSVIAQLEEALRTFRSAETQQEAAQSQRMAQLSGQLEQLQQQTHMSAHQLTQLAEQVQLQGSRLTMDQIAGAVRRASVATAQIIGNRGLGSGILIQDRAGKLYIITNHHVTTGTGIPRDGSQNGYYRVRLYNGTDNREPFEFQAVHLTLPDGKPAESAEYDISVLEVPRDIQLPSNIRPIEIRDVSRDSVQAGEFVFVIGSPLGQRDSVSFGIVSSGDRRIPPHPGNRYIQSDAAINPGNSGGLMADSQGRLIGMNQVMLRGSQFGDGNGIGCAIRVDSILEYLGRIGIPMRRLSDVDPTNPGTMPSPIVQPDTAPQSPAPGEAPQPEGQTAPPSTPQPDPAPTP